MRVKRVREIAAKLLNTSQDRILFDGKNLKKIKEVMTREDIKTLILDGVIKKKKTPRQSKARARKRKLEKKKGRHSGKGKKKGTQKAKRPKKERWILKVRAQRKTLRDLLRDNIITRDIYRSLYKKIGGGYFRGKKHLESYARGIARARGEKG